MSTRISLTTLNKMTQDGDKITMLTCYDASFAAVLDAAGVDTLLIGDSLGMAIQGHDSTLPVTLADVAYHTACVARGARRAWIIADMPFGTFQVSPAEAFKNAVHLMAAGAQMVKLEGGEPMVETIKFLTSRGVPVCGHLGLTPQSVNTLGGYRIQGKTDAAAKQLIAEAKMVEAAGASMLVLELMPAAVARDVTAALRIPTIGIGAGVDCAGQVLVLHDMLDVYPGKKARFVKNFLAGTGSVQAAVEAYVREVKAKTFPAAEHSY
jgi:3-methyl-2-oxobutanoate hydroxymethyltransferase